MSYLNASVNPSPVIAGAAGAVIENGAHKAVTFDSNGKIILPATAGAVVIGSLIGTTPDAVAVDDTLTVQIKDIGLIVAGATIKSGELISTLTTGKVRKAINGDFILGQALTGGTDGAIIQYQVLKCGFVSMAAALGDLSDVTIATPADNQVLTYNSTTHKWGNEANPTV